VARHLSDDIRLAKEANLRRLWLEQVKAMSSAAPDASKRLAAKALMEAIEIEWNRRRALPLGTPNTWGYTSKEWSNLASSDQAGRSIENWPTTGMLSKLGYRVGKFKGLEPALRRDLLRAIFESRLPPLNSEEYMELWGEPSSSERLMRMMLTITGLAAHGRNHAGYEQAVNDWLSDTAFMARSFRPSRERL
jgi:hypothetical protein